MYYSTYVQKLSSFNFKTTQPNPLTKNSYCENTNIVLTVVSFVVRLGCVVLKLKLDNIWT